MLHTGDENARLIRIDKGYLVLTHNGLAGRLGLACPHSLRVHQIQNAVRQTVPSVIVVPVDYSENMKLSAHLKEVYQQSEE